ncbi:MAG: Hint domain-containing protein [Pseudomonadota bacterium]
MPDFLNGLFFSEILADNAGGGALNTNGQGGANKQDEFVEIQNNTGSTIDLEGYQIWSSQNGLLHTFQENDDIPAGGTATVVGTFNNPPAGFFGANGNNNSASGSGGFLEDGEGGKRDTLYLADPDGNYIVLSYGDPPQTPTNLPSGFPTGGAQQGAGESVNSNAPNGTALLRDENGDFVEGSADPGTPGFVCFAEGTLIATQHGCVAVETIAPGTPILTKDYGFRPLLAVRCAPIGRCVLRICPDLRPVVIPKGVLGNNKPLRVSPAHKVLISDAMAEVLLSFREVFVPAIHLVGRAGIYQETMDKPIVYYHLLFDQHQILNSNGCWTESLFMGDVAHAALALAAGWKVWEGVSLGDLRHKETARPVLKRHESALLSASWAKTTEMFEQVA